MNLERSVSTFISIYLQHTHTSHMRSMCEGFFPSNLVFYFFFGSWERKKMENFLAEYRVWIYDTVVYGCTPPKNKLNRSRCFGKIISIVNKCMRAKESPVSRAWWLKSLSETRIRTNFLNLLFLNKYVENGISYHAFDAEFSWVAHSVELHSAIFFG